MDTNEECASRLGQHGCAESEVSWFRSQTHDFSSDTLGGPAAEWKVPKGRCPWVKEGE